MRVEHVRAFVALAEELNFRRAAARLFISQPTLTAQIHQLERSLGVELFDRGPAGTRLTRPGEELLPVARDVLRSVEDLLDGAGAWRGGPAPPRSRRRRVRVGVGPGGLGTATWPTLQALVDRRPDLEPRAVPLTFRTTLPALDRGEVEAVLVHGPVDEPAHRRVTTVGQVRAAVLLPRHHWLAHRTTIGVDDVAPLVRAVPPSEMGEAFARFWLIADHPLSPATGLRLGSEEMHAMAAEAARSGLVGLWPADVELPAVPGLVVRPLAEERLAPLQVVTRVGWQPAEDLVAAATVAMTSVAGVGGVLDRIAPAARSDQEA
jgi:DNA-binding transcriptional LysR family regulator